MPFAIADREVAHRFAASPPAARFAIETALLDALARERGVSIAAMLDPIVNAASAEPLGDAARAAATEDPRVGDGGEPRAEVMPLRCGPLGSSRRVVPLAVVVDDPQAAQRAFADGIRCLKIKLAATDDPGRVFAVASAVPEARLRIDANRSWPRAEVVDRLAALARLPIDYVEEPCLDAHLLLAEPLPCKIALDESLLAMTSDEIHAALRSPQLAAIVLKPTLLGGVSAVIPLAALARRSGVAAIISHSLEGPIGTAACAEIALALAGGRPACVAANATPGDAPPAGLAAHAALAGWRIEVPQLAADHLHHAAAPGLGFVDLDLGGVVRA
jgi:L-alanine-DL-glutamate epimerase-like enolase superfamily enzyme